MVEQIGDLVTEYFNTGVDDHATILVRKRPGAETMEMIKIKAVAKEDAAAFLRR